MLERSMPPPSNGTTAWMKKTTRNGIDDRSPRRMTTRPIAYSMTPSALSVMAVSSLARITSETRLDAAAARTGSLFTASRGRTASTLRSTAAVGSPPPPSYGNSGVSVV